MRKSRKRGRVEKEEE
jgi:hypothetical protein